MRELADIEPDAMQILSTIAAAGPWYGVRLMAVSERPVAEPLGICPCIDHFGTRLVRQTASEEDSVALLGMSGAEYLGAGGLAFLRLEGSSACAGQDAPRFLGLSCTDAGSPAFLAWVEDAAHWPAVSGRV